MQNNILIILLKIQLKNHKRYKYRKSFKQVPAGVSIENASYIENNSLGDEEK